MGAISAFLYPQRYNSDGKRENVALNQNLQKFGQQVNVICHLVNRGNLSPYEAIDDIEALWEQLERAKQQLRVDG